jgi:hypothetical protein
MTNILSSPSKGWESINSGNFPRDYASEFTSRDTRTALQKAIDKNDPYFRVERKKSLGEGDLQMKGEKDSEAAWESFELSRASHLINNEGKRIEIRQLKNGNWINYAQYINDIINNTLLDKKAKFPTPNN